MRRIGMRNKITIFAIAGLLVCLGITLPSAQAGEKCSLETMAGTYAFYEKGSSLLVNLSGNPPAPPFWAAGIAPFLTVGEVTFNPQGVGEGFYWIIAGSLSGGSEPTYVPVTIFEMNPDCTGKFRYSVTLPGTPGPTLVEERFIAFNNGNEYRSVPSSVTAGVPGIAWTGFGHRIQESSEHFKSEEHVYSCGHHMAHGTYLLTAENIVNVGPAPPPGFAQTGLADALFIREAVSPSGKYKGTLYEKLGDLSIDKLPVFGEYTVNPDCSFSSTLDFYLLGDSTTLVTIVIKGVFFNEGKEFYGLAIDIGVPYSFVQGERISQ